MIDRERYLLWTGKYYPNKMYGFYDTKSIQKIPKVDLFESCLLDYIFIKVYGLYFINMKWSLKIGKTDTFYHCNHSKGFEISSINIECTLYPIFTIQISNNIILWRRFPSFCILSSLELCTCVWVCPYVCACVPSKETFLRSKQQGTEDYVIRIHK